MSEKLPWNNLALYGLSVYAYADFFSALNRNVADCAAAYALYRKTASAVRNTRVYKKTPMLRTNA